MFTGIVEEVGAVRTSGNRLTIECSRVLEGSGPGASIAVNGVCLTAVDLTANSFSADLSPETLARTNLGDLRPGSLVNLERPMSLADRLSGHLVQGHVDGVGELLSLDSLADNNWWLRVQVPSEFDRYLIHKGSITLDGISLTIAELNGTAVSVAIIPHTYENTSLRTGHPGDRVNIEVDLIAKYVEKMLPPRAS